MQQIYIDIEATEIAARLDAVHDALIAKNWTLTATKEMLESLAKGGFFNDTSHS